MSPAGQVRVGAGVPCLMSKGLRLGEVGPMSDVGGGGDCDSGRGVREGGSCEIQRSNASWIMVTWGRHPAHSSY